MENETFIYHLEYKGKERSDCFALWVGKTVLSVLQQALDALQYEPDELKITCLGEANVVDEKSKETD